MKSLSVEIRLAIMMFLQYGAMGAALSTLGLVLGSHGMAPWIAVTFAVGGMVTMVFPVLMGILADRFVPAQWLLGMLNIVCCAALFEIPATVTHQRVHTFILLMAVYYSSFVPATAIANRIAFHSLGTDKQRFTLIRTCGTLGFFAGTLVIGVSRLSASVATFWVASSACALVALCSFALPHTPPARQHSPLRLREVFGLDALSLLRDRQYRIFLICTLLLFVPMMAHLSYLSLFLGDAGYDNVGTLLSIGQISELLFMTLLAFLLNRLGFRRILVLATGAWFTRMIFLSAASTHPSVYLIVFAIILHGMAWDFFFVTGEIYSNELASAAIKSQAQGLWKTMTFGVGVIIGSIVTGGIFNTLIHGAGAGHFQQWQHFWLVSAGFSAFAMLILVVFFTSSQMAPMQASEQIRLDVFGKGRS